MSRNNEVLCGLGSWRPDFLQRLASKKIYMVIYGALGIIQGMFFTYLSATLTTLEREFGIKSREAAILMSGNEISQILFLFVMPCIIKVKKRPLWIAMGLYCSAFGCFLMALPHWTKPQQLYQVSETQKFLLNCVLITIVMPSYCYVITKGSYYN